MSRIIGIDLGTSNSAASIMEGGRPTVIPSAEGTSVGGKSFPSYVAFTKDGQLLVGEPARRQAVTNPDGTIKNVKRKMGSNEKVTALGKEYTPQQISAFILQKIKRDAESYLGGEKIDVIEYCDDPIEYIARALSPAQVLMVSINEEEKNAKVIVPDEKLSLAIGRSGQNARLAAKLTGWKIDVKPYSTLKMDEQETQGE